MAKVKKKVNRLIDFSISEVSLVDRPANDQAKVERVSIAKRADAEGDDALLTSKAAKADDCAKCKAMGENKKCDMHMKAAEKAEGTPLSPDPVVNAASPEQRKGLLHRVAEALGFKKVQTEGDNIILTTETPRTDDGKFTFDISADTKAFLEHMEAAQKADETHKREVSEQERQAAADKRTALPDAGKDDEKKKAVAAEIIKFFGGDVQKGMYAVAALATLVSDLANAARAAMYENEGEGDDSKVPTELAALRDQLGAVLVTMAAEEVAELGEPNDEGGVMAMADELSPEMKKMLEDYQNGTGLFAKAGASHSKATMEKMQDMHDHLAAMGAGPHATDADTEKLDAKGNIEKRGRYAKADQTHLDAAHEVCKGFGVGCMTPKVETAAAIDAFKSEMRSEFSSFADRIEKALGEKLGTPTPLKVNISSNAPAAGTQAVNRDGTTHDAEQQAAERLKAATAAQEVDENGDPIRKVAKDSRALVGLISKVHGSPGRNVTELYN